MRVTVYPTGYGAEMLLCPTCQGYHVDTVACVAPRPRVPTVDEAVAQARPVLAGLMNALYEEMDAAPLHADTTNHEAWSACVDRMLRDLTALRQWRDPAR